MALTGDWAPGDGVWLAQEAQVQTIYVCFPHDQKGWTQGPLSLLSWAPLRASL